MLIGSHLLKSTKPTTAVRPRRLPRSLAIIGALLFHLCAVSSTNIFGGEDDAGGQQSIQVFGPWSQLDSLPDKSGFAGPFAGVSHDALIVAGGANFPEGPPWKDKPKVWHDRVFVLARPNGKWTEMGQRLPADVGYGVSITMPEGIICIGGCNARACSRKVFVLTWDPDPGKPQLEVSDRLLASGQARRDVWPLPELPVPLAFMGGALAGDVIYLAGGQSTMGETATASAEFWRLDLSKRLSLGNKQDEFQWERLPWPAGAPRRILPVVVAQQRAGNQHLYMFSGRDRPGGADANLLRDAWAFAAGSTRSKSAELIANEAWQRLTDCPRCLMAGCGVGVGIDHVLVIGGDDGRHWGKDLRDDHPGFAADTLFAYHTLTDTWLPAAGRLPQNHVTTVAVKWKDAAGEPAVVIPSGEIRPGVRSPAVWVAPIKRADTKFGLIDYSVVIVYLAALVAMGVYFSRREKSTDDFFLAGRRIPWWAAGMSIFGTQLSAITFMAIPAKTYADNWVFFLQNMGIVAIAPLVAFVYLPFFRRLDVTTAYEYLERRFSLGVRLVGSSSFIAFQLGRMGIVVFLPALALSAVTGWNVYVCIAAMGILATIYTVLGGIEAVIWTDVLQVGVLLGGAVVALAIVIGSIDGGVVEVVSVAASNDKLRLANWNWDFTSEALFVILLGAFFNNIVPYTTDQAVIQRYLTTSSEKQARKAIWTNAVLTVPASLLFFAVGTALWVYYKNYPAALTPLEKGDQIFPWFIAQQLPVGIAGLVIAGIFAAAMSSLDSGMNSVATACVTDFYRRFRPQASDHYCLNLARWLTVLLGVLGTGTAMLMATFPIKSLWELFLALMGLLGGTLGGLFGLGIFTRRTAAVHAWIGAVASAAILVLVWLFSPISGLLYAAIGVTSCIVVAWIAGWLFPAPSNWKGLCVFSLGKPQSS